MPCYDARDDSSYVRAETEREVRADCRHNSDVAELLCFVMNNLNSATRIGLLANNVALAKWWGEHVERDRKKAEREQRKAHNEAIDRQIRDLQRKKK